MLQEKPTIALRVYRFGDEYELAAFMPGQDAPFHVRKLTGVQDAAVQLLRFAEFIEALGFAARVGMPPEMARMMHKAAGRRDRVN